MDLARRHRLFVALAALLLASACAGPEEAAPADPAGTPALRSITINYPTRSGASWPLYIAKNGGYYEKYGLDVTLAFGVHPSGIAMLTSGEAAIPHCRLLAPLSDKMFLDQTSFPVLASSTRKSPCPPSE